MSATNVARTGKRGNICVGNNVCATMSVSSFARAFSQGYWNRHRKLVVGRHFTEILSLDSKIRLQSGKDIS